jgi:hypothetical protein
MNLSTLTQTIVDSIKKVQSEEILFKQVYSDLNTPILKNQFLFFVKPEITLESSEIDLPKILTLIFEKIKNFNFNIHNVNILSAKYLDQFDIIAQHYGVINKISSNAIENMSDSAKDKFKEIYSKSVNEVKVLGGEEFLNVYSNFNAYSLDYLCQNIENKKLAGGTYCVTVKMDDEIIYLINGFHPRQLKQFTEKGRSIITMTLSSDMDWADARSNFIGATNPLNANKGSLRREFLDNKDGLGLAEVSQGVNGVHLSAGPIEALVELKRYNSNFLDNSVKDFSEFPCGKDLNKKFSNEVVQKILDNINLTVDNKVISVFDLTEEKNSAEVIELLGKQF